MAGKSTDVSARFKLVDKISAPLKKVQANIGRLGTYSKSLEERINKPFDTMRKNLRKINRAAGNVGTQFSNLATKLTAPLAALAGMGAFSMKSAVSDFISYGDAIDKASIRAGIGAEALQKLRYAATFGGMDAEQMDRALVKLGNQMGQIANGSGQKLETMFKQLGVRYKDANGKMRNTAEVMRELADSIKANQDPTTRLQILTDIFGDRLAGSLVPVLQDGAEGLDAMAKAAEKDGIVTEEQVKNAAALGDKLSELRTTIRWFSLSSVGDLAPKLMEIVDRLKDILQKNKELIHSRLTKFVKQFVDALDKVDFEKVINKTFDFIEGVGQLMDRIGGLKTILIAWAAIMGGRLVMNAWNLGAAILGLGKVLATALGPWPMIIGAVVGAVVYLWNNCEGFRNFVLKAVDAILENWGKLSAWFKKLPGNAKAAFDKTVSKIKGFGNEVYNHIMAPFEGLKTKLLEVKSSIENSMPDWLKDAFGLKTEIKASSEKASAAPNAVPIALPSARPMMGSMTIDVSASNGAVAKVVDLQAQNGDLILNNYSTYEPSL